eukprot:Blabericola_migrator_1__11457@NODE_681_length_6903_cov_298_280281_g495_i0_p1_GENE_NODE_681_length_6903_cov_298_280281_g495_i0NODE_681_length_6903_cov_298_280281_g495_i0_p1_ORF_typecomplete_len1154_score173_23_NODE_681_length_6903_cov_298_280281_g495_i04793940
MLGSGRCVLRRYNKCQATRTAGTFGLGVCCVLSMYEAGDFANHEAQWSPFPTRPQEGTVNSQPPTNAPSYDTDEAWHDRAQTLLTQVLKADWQVPVQSEVWDQVTEVLAEAENILKTRCFSNDELKTINQINMVAVKFAPLYPCVSQCAKLCYEIRASAESAQGLPYNANTASPRPSETGVEAPLRADLEKPQNFSQSNDPSYNLASPTHVSSEAQTSGAPLRFASLQGKDPSCYPESYRPRECYAVSAESFQSDKRLEQFKAAPTSQSLPSASLPLLANDLVETDRTAGGKVDYDGATHESLALVEENIAKVIVDLDHAHQNAGKSRTSAKLINVKEQLNTLCRSLSGLHDEPLTLDAHSLVTLTRMRFSLMTARGKVTASRGVRLSNRYMTRLNSAIFNISHLWLQARLANLNTDDSLQPQELESFREVTEFPERVSTIGCIASTTYATLLTTHSDKKARKIVHDFLTFSSMASQRIDLETAKLYLLILLYFRHGNVRLIEPRLQDPLGKLIATLRGEILRSEKIGISLFELSEFQELCLAYFKVSTCHGFDWRNSLDLSNTLVRSGQKPIITNLAQCGKVFCDGLDQLTRFVTSSKLASDKGIYAAQVKSLEAFRRHLLSIDPPTDVFTNDQTLAHLEQFAYFAELCLNQCEVEGHAGSREQVRLLEVTLDCLHWCRLLSSYLEVPSPEFLEGMYDTVANALILTSLWSHRNTEFLCNSERAFISRSILSILKSNKLDDRLLGCIRMFFDKNVPSRFARVIFDEMLLYRAQKTSDYDRMLTLLALECRMNLYRADIAFKPELLSMPSSIRNDFAEALVQARLIALGVKILPAPDLPLEPSLQERFVASPAHKAARHLSVDVVLDEALKETSPDEVTVSEVAHHVAAYLLGNPVDKQWLDFLTCQMSWCSFTPKQLAKHHSELVTLVQSLDTFLKAFWFKGRWAKPLDSSAEATPDLIRHFVNTVTLKWLFTKLVGDSMCSAEDWEFLHKVAGDHVFAWIPKWMVFMHGSQALFPSDVTVDADFFARLCVDLSRQTKFTALPKEWLDAPMEHFRVSVQLRRLIKGVCLGVVTPQDFEALLSPHESRVVLRWNRNLFLAVLLYVWHDNSLPVDMAVIAECIKIVLSEGALYSGDVGMSVSTMQKCIEKLLTM